MVQPLTESLTLGENIFSLSTKKQVSLKTELNSEYISKCLSNNVAFSITERKIESGKLYIYGRVNFYISYIDSVGEIKKYEGMENVDCELLDQRILDSATSSISYSCDKIDFDKSGIKLSLNVDLKILATIYCLQNVDIINGGDNIILKKDEEQIVKSYGLKKTIYPMEEQFDLNYVVKDVLNQNANVVISQTSCGVGNIIVDGEVYFSCLLLQNDEKKTIIRENKSFTFRVEIDYDEAMPNMSAVASLIDKSVKLDVSVDEENNKSIVTILFNLSFIGEVYSFLSTEIPNDVFSISDELSFSIKECETNYILSPKAYFDKIQTTLGVDNVENLTFISVLDEKVLITKNDINNDGLFIEGIVNLSLLYTDEENRLIVKKAMFPIEYNIKEQFIDCKNIDLTAYIVELNAVSINNELNIDCKICYNVYVMKCTKTRYISEINSTGEKAICDSAISVYIPLQNEDLWTLAKRLNTCPDDIIINNKDLQFPLTGEERIVVFRKIR